MSLHVFQNRETIIANARQACEMAKQAVALARAAREHVINGQSRTHHGCRKPPCIAARAEILGPGVAVHEAAVVQTA